MAPAAEERPKRRTGIRFACRGVLTRLRKGAAAQIGMGLGIGFDGPGHADITGLRGAIEKIGYGGAFE